MTTYTKHFATQNLEPACDNPLCEYHSVQVPLLSFDFKVMDSEGYSYNFSRSYRIHGSTSGYLCPVCDGALKIWRGMQFES